MDCPVCKKKIPLLSKVLFNQTVGLECASCHSLLAHYGRHIVCLLLVLIALLYLLLLAIENGGLYWVGASLLMALLVVGQYLAPLKVVSENMSNVD